MILLILVIISIIVNILLSFFVFRSIKSKKQLEKISKEFFESIYNDNMQFLASISHIHDSFKLSSDSNVIQLLELSETYNRQLLYYNNEMNKFINSDENDEKKKD